MPPKARPRPTPVADATASRAGRTPIRVIVPRLGGQNYDYLVSALTGYKKGDRSHPTMRAQGESLSDEDIRDISAFLAGIKP